MSAQSVPGWIKPLYLVSALYDGVIGFAFLIAPGFIFEKFGVSPPNHFAYVQFPALLLMIFAALFYRIATDPIGNRGLIPYGIALKVAYCSTAFFYQAKGGIPWMWMPFAWADLVFLVLFVASWRTLGGASAQGTARMSAQRV